MYVLMALGIRLCRLWLLIVGCLIILFCTPVMVRAQGCIDHACVSVGANLVTIDSTQSELLDSLLTSLLGDGTAVDVSAGNYNELLNGRIGLLDLLGELQVDLGLQSPGEVLTTNLTLGDLLQAAINVANRNGSTGLALALNDLLLDIGGVTQEIQLGDLLDLKIGASSLTNVKLNLLDLVTGSIQLFNFAHVNGPTAAVIVPGVVLSELGLDSTIGQITLIARVLEPPTFVCGPQDATFNTAPMRLLLDVAVLDLALDTSGLETNLLGQLGSLLDIVGNLANVSVEANATVGQLSLLVEIARGQGVIQSINAVSNAVTIEATPGVANLYLGQINPALALDRNHDLSPADLDFTNIATLDLSIQFSGLLDLLLPDVSIADIAIGAKAHAEGETAASSFQYTGPYSQTHEFIASASALDALLASLINNLEINLDVALLQSGLGNLLGGPGLNTFINELLAGLLGTLQNPSGGLLNQLLDPILGETLNPLLDTLGIRLGQMAVTVHGLVALCPDLSISKRHLGAFTVGAKGNYTIIVRNVGRAPTAHPTTVIDTLPGELRFVTATGVGWSVISHVGQTVILQNSMAVAPNVNLPQLTLTVDAVAAGDIVNTATVTVTGDSNTANNSALDPTLINPAPGASTPDLTISKSHSGDFAQGALHTYLIVVQNVGASDTTGVTTVADTLPSGMSYISHSGEGWEFVSMSGSTVTFAQQTSVAPTNALPNLLINVIANSTGLFTNTATVSTAGDLNTANNLTLDATVVNPQGSDDDDGDGISNEDECPAPPDCPDTDGDGQPNPQDSDDDGDGIPTRDECPNYPTCPDTDEDGAPNYLDPDDDGDGIPTRHECPNYPTCPDTDEDSAPNYLDPDDDGDGIPTRHECPNYPNCPDTDGDGAPNYLDPDDDGDGVLTRFENPDPNGNHEPSDAQDTDGDGNPDYLDNNDDGDSRPTIDEQADPNGDGDPADAVDTDGDNIPDYLDPDDGVPGNSQGRIMIPLLMNLAP
jgi:uncharacterized repeat protein (TIGR01451 family)